MDISVIIPTYCPGPYLQECLQSLQAQTLSKGRFQVLLVLNGPVDEYEGRVRSYLEQTTLDWKLLTCALPGVSRARNMGLKQAQGRFVAFLDDDDWVSPSYLEHLLDVSDEESIGVTLVQTYDEKTHALGSDYLTRAYRRLGGRNQVSLLRGRTFMSSCWCKLIPMAVIGERTFVEQLSQGEDAFFMATISDGVRCIRRAGEEAVYYRRLRQGSVSRSRGGLLRRVAHAFHIQHMYVKLYMSSPSTYSLRFFFTRIVGTWMVALFDV